MKKQDNMIIYNADHKSATYTGSKAHGIEPFTVSMNDAQTEMFLHTLVMHRLVNLGVKFGKQTDRKTFKGWKSV
jgi:hypothetical protein